MAEYPEKVVNIKVIGVGGAGNNVVNRMLSSGVEGVDRFDETEIVMTTSDGVLIVTGENLHIGSLSLDGGELRVDGRIDALAYEDGGAAPEGGRRYGSAPASGAPGMPPMPEAGGSDAPVDDIPF